MLNKYKIDSWILIKISILCLAFIFIMYPLLILFKNSFSVAGSNSFSIENYLKFFLEKRYKLAFLNSFILCFLVSIISAIIGFPLAYIVTRYDIKGSNILKIIFLSSMMSPPFIGAYSWILLLGNNGVIRNFFQSININLFSIYGISGMVFAFSVNLFPFVFFYCIGSLKKIDSSLEEASNSLGYGKIKRLFTITIPLIFPSLTSAILLVFITTLADFGTPLLLGRETTTLPVLIYNEFVSEIGGDAHFASSIGVITIFFVMLIFLIQKYMINRKSYSMSALNPIEKRKIKSLPIKVLIYFYCFSIAFIALLPTLTIVYTSFKNVKRSSFKEGFSLDSYIETFGRLGNEIINSFYFSLFSLIIIIFSSLLISYLIVRKKGVLTRIIDYSIMLPYIIPGTIIGVVYLVTFNSSFIVLTGTPAIMIIALTVRKMSFTLRSSISILYQIPTSIEEASISLGVSPIKSFFKITTVLMLPGISSGALLAWLRLINELSASIMIYTPKTKTMPIAIYTQIINGKFGTASAISTILSLSTILLLVLYYKINKEVDI